MALKTRGVYDLLRGSFLTDDSSVKNWRIILFVVLLLLMMIWSAHSVQAKAVKVARLKKEKKELRAEYIDTSTVLMRMRLESSVRKKVNKMGLAPAEKPPQKIKVTQKK